MAEIDVETRGLVNIQKDVVKTNGFPKKMIDKWWLFHIKVLLCRMYIMYLYIYGSFLSHRGPPYSSPHIAGWYIHVSTEKSE